MLLIEDDSEAAHLISRLLSREKSPSFVVEWKNQLTVGLNRLQDGGIDAILLDLTLPDSQGLETVIKAYQHARGIPIVVLTGVDDETIALQAVRRGAQDYLVKGEVDGRILSRIIRYAIERTHVLEELRKAHNELKATQSQLIEAEKFDSVGRLAAGVAHEVKNPLAIMLQCIDYLRQQISGKSAEVNQTLKDMEYAVERADSVIGGLLDFSSLSELSTENTRLDELIEETLVLTKHEFDRAHIQVINDIEPNVPPMKLNRNRMQQVFVNLLLNSVHASPNGGELRIKTSAKILRSGDKEFSTGGERDFFHPGDQLIVVTIDDSGTGIPENIIGKIFDPFFTTRRGRGGTGLGLPIVKNIVEMHNGRIKITNRTPHGARTVLAFKI